MNSFSIGTAKFVTDAVVNSTVFQTSKCVSCYLSMPKGELDTAPLVSAILAAGSFTCLSPRKRRKRAIGSFIPGKVLYVPKLDTSDSSHPRMDMLRVCDQPDLDSFPSGLWGIREPAYEKDGEARSNGNPPFTSLAFVPGPS
jgi:5-formyltetrahydrofolate cyclo-ligase